MDLRKNCRVQQSCACQLQSLNHTSKRNVRCAHEQNQNLNLIGAPSRGAFFFGPCHGNDRRYPMSSSASPAIRAHATCRPSVHAVHATFFTRLPETPSAVTVLGATRPIHRINTAAYVVMKTRIRPQRNALYITVLDRVPMDVIRVPLEITLIADLMLPESPLP